MNHYDVIVVGLGAMGSSAALHLADRGIRVLGIEQFDIPHALGSSTGFSRMIRMAYYEHPDYVPLLRRAYALWADLESRSGQKLLHLTGGLYMGPRDGGLICGSLAAATQHALEHSVLTDRDIARRFPQFTLPEDWVGVHEPLAGFLIPERAIAATADLALRRGAELHGRETVVSWSVEGSSATLSTTRGNYAADRLIFCGGAWTRNLMQSANVELPNLRVTRQVQGWVWPRKPERFALGTLPVWAIDHADGSLHYGFPMMSDNPGFKIAHHAPASETDPDHVNRHELAGDEETFRPALRRFIPDADGPLLSLRTCLYTNSPDHHFIIDHLPGHPRVTIACGFSGHGFKFASVIGEIIADLSVTGSTRLPAAFLGLRRFAPDWGPGSMSAAATAIT